MPLFHPVQLMRQSKAVVGLNMLTLWDEHGSLAQYVDPLTEWAEDGRIEPVVAEAFPLERAADVLNASRSRPASSVAVSAWLSPSADCSSSRSVGSIQRTEPTNAGTGPAIVGDPGALLAGAGSNASNIDVTTKAVRRPITPPSLPPAGHLRRWAERLIAPPEHR